MKYPKYLYRSDDGFRFTLQSNGKYSIDISMMNPRYEYSYDCLISHGFVESLSKCKITTYKSNNDGHGNGDYDE